MTGVQRTTTPVFTVFVDQQGHEVTADHLMATELRCAGPDWPWHDQDGRIWGHCPRCGKGLHWMIKRS